MKKLTKTKERAVYFLTAHILLMTVFTGNLSYASWTYTQGSGNTGTITDGNWVLNVSYAAGATSNNITIGTGTSTAGNAVVTADPNWELDLSGIVTNASGDPKTITGIGSYSFKATQIYRVILPETLATIGNEAFRSCANITTVTPFLPDTVTSIGTYAFEGCKLLEGDLVLSNPSLTSISENSFYNAEKIDSIDMSGSGILTIAGSSFQNCKGIGYVCLPSNLVSIGGTAFQTCSTLTNVTPFLPDTVTSMGTYAFEGCKLLEGDLVLSNPSFASVPQNAFANAEKINSIMFGSGIISIAGGNTFQNCRGVRQVWFCGDVPTFTASSFSGWTNSQARVYVPSGNPTWETYADSLNGSITNVIPLTSSQEIDFADAYPGEKMAIGRYYAPGMTSPNRLWYCLYDPFGGLLKTMIIVR